MALWGVERWCCGVPLRRGGETGRCGDAGEAVVVDHDMKAVPASVQSTEKNVVRPGVALDACAQEQHADDGEKGELQRRGNRGGDGHDGENCERRRHTQRQANSCGGAGVEAHVGEQVSPVDINGG